MEVFPLKYEEEITFKLAKEMTELWLECKIRCEKIEEIAKKIKDIKNVES